MTIATGDRQGRDGGAGRWGPVRERCRTPGRDREPTAAVALGIGPGGIEEPGLVEHQRQAGEGEDRYYRMVPNDRSLVVGRTLFTLSEMGLKGSTSRRRLGSPGILFPFE